jgi:type IV secretory pathway VirB10-like protein
MKAVETNGIQTDHAAMAAPGKVGAAVPSNNKAQEPAAGNKDQERRLSKAGVRVAAFAIVAGLVVMILGPAWLRHAKTAQIPLIISSKPTKAPNQPDTSNREPLSSKTPIVDATRPPEKAVDQTGVNAEEIAHTATAPPAPSAPGSLGDVPPIGARGAWTPPPYHGTDSQPEESGTGEPAQDARSEHDAMDKASLVFVKSRSAAPDAIETSRTPAVEVGIGLPPGTRLRARLESAVNSAVTTPVVAVIQYNYERSGEIVIPAGAKVFGRLEAADRSGYVGIRFDSLMMPDGTSMQVEAAATDLQLRPLRGRVEGKNTGKNIVIRSLAGVGEIGAALVGRGSLNQPLSESDLLRERVSTNIGQASDQQLSSLALTQRIVVSVPAGREIYVVLEKAAKEGPPTRSQRSTELAGQPSIEELRQLLRLQREMNATSPAPHE